MRTWDGAGLQSQKLDCDPESQPSDAGKFPTFHAKWETQFISIRKIVVALVSSWLLCPGTLFFPSPNGYIQTIPTSLYNLTLRLTEREEIIKSVWPHPTWCPAIGQSLLQSNFVGLSDMICLPFGPRTDPWPISIYRDGKVTWHRVWQLNEERIV